MKKPIHPEPAHPEPPHPKPIHLEPIHQLALRVVDIAQIFNSMDPTPFLNKDIDPEAEAYIESWAAGFAPNSRFHIIVHAEQWPSDGDPTEMVTGAIHNHFSFKAQRARGMLKHFLKQGRISLVIGFVFVSLCLIAADAIAKLGTNTGLTIARESLTIVAWGCHVATVADFFVRLVAVSAANSTIRKLEYCPNRSH